MRARTYAAIAAVGLLGVVGGWVGLHRAPAEAAAAAAAPLSALDLPGFHEMWSNGHAADGTDIEPCGRGPGISALGPPASRQRVSLTREQPDLFVNSTTAVLPVGANLDVLRDMFAGCSAWTDSGNHYTAVPASYGQFADETFAVTITATTATTNVVVAFVAIRKGRLVECVSVAAEHALLVGNVNPAVRAAAAKLG